MAKELLLLMILFTATSQQYLDSDPGVDLVCKEGQRMIDATDKILNETLKNVFPIVLLLPKNISEEAELIIKNGEIMINNTLQSYYDSLEELHQKAGDDCTCFIGKRKLLSQVHKFILSEVKDCIEYHSKKVNKLEDKVYELSEILLMSKSLRLRGDGCQISMDDRKLVSDTNEGWAAAVKKLVIKAKAIGDNIRRIYRDCGRDRAGIIETAGDHALLGVKKCVDNLAKGKPN